MSAFGCLIIQTHACMHACTRTQSCAVKRTRTHSCKQHALLRCLYVDSHVLLYYNEHLDQWNRFCTQTLRATPTKGRSAQNHAGCLVNKHCHFQTHANVKSVLCVGESSIRILSDAKRWFRLSGCTIIIIPSYYVLSLYFY